MNTSKTNNAGYVNTSEPPVGSMFTVHCNGDEAFYLWNKINCDDGIGSNSKGRLRLDKDYLKNGRKRLKTGTWNVRTLFERGKLENLTREAEEMNLDILGVTEHRGTDEGTITKDKNVFVYSEMGRSLSTWSGHSDKNKC